MLTGGRTLSAAAAALALLAVAPATSSARADTTAPTVSIDQPWDGTRTNLDAFFRGSVSDDVTARPTVALSLAKATGEPVATTDPAESGETWFVDLPGPLEHGVEYVATAVAADEAGNETKATSRFTADGVAPAMTVTDEPAAETTDATPYVGGTSVPAAGDLPFVQLGLLRAEGPGWVGVAQGDGTIGPDGRFGAELTPAVPPGDYLLDAHQVDRSLNATWHTRPLRVLAAGDELPLPLPPAVEPSEQTLSATSGLRRAALRSLRARRLRTLVRRGAKVRVAAGQAGTAIVQLYSGRAPRDAGAHAAATRLVAQGRRAVGSSGRGTVAVRTTRRGRRALAGARRAKFTVRVRFAPRRGPAVALDAPVSLKR